MKRNKAKFYNNKSKYFKHFNRLIQEYKKKTQIKKILNKKRDKKGLK